MRIRRAAGNAVLATAAVIAAVGIAEAALRFSNRPPAVPTHVLCGCPYLYGLNPLSPEISSQGLRDRVFAIPKPQGTSRVLVLGDSVAYGVRVPPEHTFPKVLERLVDRPDRRVEVVNAGVPGYTAYNELQYYLARGRELRPDVVVVAFCLNDAVDPELHWSGTRREVPDVPEEAIPNPAYHETHVAAILGPRLPLIGRPEILRRAAMLRHPRSGPAWEERRHVTIAGKRWPTYVTGEDDFSIRVLLDPASPEWRWLRSIYGRLRAAVQADGGRLVFLLLPLAYQLEDGYPFLPQKVFGDYCQSERLACVDVLGAMRARRAEAMFPLHGEWPDVWHPTIAGHRVVAEELAGFLKRETLGP